MAGNHPSELSPRQRMINMMYLVLTALLALNVSKEVLDSFFEVNTGIVRTTNQFDTKNDETYLAFMQAVEQNPVKAGPWKDKAFQIKEKAGKLHANIQKLKYNLAFKVDNEVYLGKKYNSEGDIIEENMVEVPFDELSIQQKNLTIADLNNKEDRDASGELLVNSGEGIILKQSIAEFRDLLLLLAKGNEVLEEAIKDALNTSDKQKKKGEGKEAWESYYFNDMPSVAAFTLLSKMQSDIRNSEANVIDFLRQEIDAGSLKFTSAEAIQLPTSNFVLRGDSFKAEIFIAAKDTTQAPDIFVGEYNITESGYEMVGDYETVSVKNGKGIFKVRTTSEGLKQWGGLITMKTDMGTKTYPFKGSYLVANKSVVVSPVNMNVFYLEVDNPVKISVPGFAAADITASMTNGNIKVTKKSAGEYTARPTKKGKATVTLFTTIEGKRTRMGSMEFRVKEVPPPTPKIGGKSEGVIEKQRMLAAGGIQAKLEDFDFKGVRYKVVAYSFTTVYKGDQVTETVNGQEFTTRINAIINNTKSGNSITVSNIMARRTDAKGTATRSLPPLVLKIK
ncbi:MAG TPA: GldM family protein [Flavobacteriales bacterium]|jgi:gliding motility-associated protein GldM|nr:GldM family protein [Flavobacteriales bacterium]